MNWATLCHGRSSRYRITTQNLVWDEQALLVRCASATDEAGHTELINVTDEFICSFSKTLFIAAGRGERPNRRELLLIFRVGVWLTVLICGPLGSERDIPK
jgi:hypothetical protein